jgi:hypothetical protein
VVEVRTPGTAKLIIIIIIKLNDIFTIGFELMVLNIHHLSSHFTPNKRNSSSSHPLIKESIKRIDYQKLNRQNTSAKLREVRINNKGFPRGKKFLIKLNNFFPFFIRSQASFYLLIDLIIAIVPKEH